MLTVRNFTRSHACQWIHQRGLSTKIAEYPPKLKDVKNCKVSVGHHPLEKSLDIAMVGLPNAGKSTILNRLVGDKISAISPKRNTTRDSVLGYMTDEWTQICFWDTPGFVSHLDDRNFIRSLYTSSTEKIRSVDLAVIVVDSAKRIDRKVSHNLSALFEQALLYSKEIVIVLSKVDLVNPKTNLLLKTDEVIDILERAKDEVTNEKKALTANLKDSRKTVNRNSIEAPAFAEGDTGITSMDHTTGKTTKYSLSELLENYDGSSSDEHSSDDFDESYDSNDSESENEITRRNGVVEENLSADIGGRLGGESLSTAHIHENKKGVEENFGGDRGVSSEVEWGHHEETKVDSTVKIEDDPYNMELHKKPWHRGLKQEEDSNTEEKFQYMAKCSAFRGENTTIFMVAADASKGRISSDYDEDNDGMNDLKKYLISRARKRPWLHDPRLNTNMTTSERITEVLREKLYLHLNKEVPYRVKQITLVLGIDPKTGVMICEQEFLVQSQSQQKLLSSLLGLIAKDAKEDLWKMYRRNIRLKLHVRVDKLGKTEISDPSQWL